MKALDLFCGAGGAAVGLYRAGFDVVGVDIEPQPRYPFEFHQGDALEFPTDGFDLIWASPPCQRYSVYSRNMGYADRHPDLIDPTRAKLRASGAPYIIENVPGAPLRDCIMLCGSMFDLDVRRHRLFECSSPIFPQPECRHWIWRDRKYPGATNRPNGRYTCEVGVRRIPVDAQREAMDNGPIQVCGTGSQRHMCRGEKYYPSADVCRAAMTIDWMTREELSQAIPPAYGEYIARRMFA